jgi:hypothetical protein
VPKGPICDQHFKKADGRREDDRRLTGEGRRMTWPRPDDYPSFPAPPKVASTMAREPRLSM